MSLFTTRKGFLLGFIICVISMAVALYFQYGIGLTPCPMCVMQRIAVSAAGIIFLIAFLHGSQKACSIRTYAVLALICVVTGLGVAIRQVYLQHLPPGEAPACGPGLNYLLETLPLHKVIMLVFKGTGDCAIVHFKFLKLSIAGWSIVLFAVLTILNIVLLCAPKSQKTPELKGSDHE